MEKLQAALEAARRQRSKHQGDGAGQQVPVRRQNTAAGQLWEDLKDCEVSDKVLKQHRVFTQQVGPNATPFDILRTKILLIMRQNNWTRLAITSPRPKSGKTTMACNLALGLGRQRDLRTMLFDLDLRDPSVNEFLNLKPATSLGDVFAGKVPFSEHALRIGDNVAVAMCGYLETDPTRVLLAEETAERLEEIQNDFVPDVMIFDLPAMLSGDDTRAFLKNVDCAMIVARANSTRYSDFDRCEKEISLHTNVLGTVMNAYSNQSRADAEF